ncbi:hypothetical protein ACW9I5_28910 [Pseudomonas azotoformans]
MGGSSKKRSAFSTKGCLSQLAIEVFGLIVRRSIQAMHGLHRNWRNYDSGVRKKDSNGSSCVVRGADFDPGCVKTLQMNQIALDKQPQAFHIPSKVGQEKDMPSRLASSYPDIQHVLDAIIPSKKLDVTTRIVLWAASDAGLDTAEIMVTLSKLDPVLFDNLCSAMEIQYFRLFERGDEMHLSFSSLQRQRLASS